MYVEADLKIDSGKMFSSIAKFIVDNRKIFYLVFIIMVGFCALSISKVQINYDLASYLPANTQTKQSLDLMGDEFVTFGTAQVMVRNVTLDEAQQIYTGLEDQDFDNVKAIAFDNTSAHYKNSNALYTVTFAGADGSAENSATVKEIRAHLDGYDVSVSIAENFDEYAETLMHAIMVIMIIVVFVVGLILVLSSKSYMELPIFLIVFVVAAVLNMGTNYWLGEISFISFTVAVILQLALAIDYAIILAHKFIEEKERTVNPVEAATAALSKAMPEIFASSLTTIAGLVAVMFMQLQLGLDLGLVLSKGILCSMLTVFVLMPGLLLLYTKALDKTKHRDLMPKINRTSKAIIWARKVVPVLFIAIIVFAGVYQSKITYAFSTSGITSAPKTQATLEIDAVAAEFGTERMMAVIVPAGSPAKERAVLQEIGAMNRVHSALGLANVEISEGKYLTDSFTAKEFSAAMGLDRRTVQMLYVAYALSKGEYNVVNIDAYSAPLIDLVDFLHAQIESGLVTLDAAQSEEFYALYDELTDARLQLEGEHYSRLVFMTDLPVEGQETYAFLDLMLARVHAYYPDAIMVGEATLSQDLYTTFSTDNIKITVLTVLFILLILLFTFKSVGIPLLLITVIEGGILINFAIPAIMGQSIYFFSYLVVCAIQMGATIDYAIVMTTRYQNLKLSMDKYEAARQAIVQCFPTIITSGSIMTICGFLIGFMVSDPIVSSIGMALGRGTVISLLSVLVVLPQLLVLFDKLIEKTAFKFNFIKAFEIDKSMKKLFHGSRIQITINDRTNKI